MHKPFPKYNPDPKKLVNDFADYYGWTSPEDVPDDFQRMSLNPVTQHLDKQDRERYHDEVYDYIESFRFGTFPKRSSRVKENKMNNRRNPYRARNKFANITTRELINELENRKRASRAPRKVASTAEGLANEILKDHGNDLEEIQRMIMSDFFGLLGEATELHGASIDDAMSAIGVLTEMSKSVRRARSVNSRKHVASRKRTANIIKKAMEFDNYERSLDEEEAIANAVTDIFSMFEEKDLFDWLDGANNEVDKAVMRFERKIDDDVASYLQEALLDPYGGSTTTPGGWFSY